MLSPSPSNPQPQSRLTQVTRGKLPSPMRIVLYGTDGIGKSTFAAHAPSPIFLGAEDGTAHLDVARMPPIQSWPDLLESAHELATLPHDFKTIVLDTADWAEPMCWQHVAAREKKAHIEDLAYGKGYAIALNEWRIFLSILERAKARGMNVIILAHSLIKTFKNPAGEDFDRYEMKLHQKASGLLREWADCVLFASYETFVSEMDGRSKGVSSGARLIHTERTAAFDAKNRSGLPAALPLDWGAFHQAHQAASPSPAPVLRGKIEALLAGSQDEVLIANVRKAVESAGEDSAKLARYLDSLTAKIALQEIAP